ncbi:unnamed protein product [marine sediment metagenome]|uniref:Uncharacterized protein n=1 Tax=marine sediment metagenome TaxID=412755 RepID=X1NYS2_9ZZZZ
MFIPNPKGVLEVSSKPVKGKIDYLLEVDGVIETVASTLYYL